MHAAAGGASRWGALPAAAQVARCGGPLTGGMTALRLGARRCLNHITEQACTNAHLLHRAVQLRQLRLDPLHRCCVGDLHVGRTAPLVASSAACLAPACI